MVFLFQLEVKFKWHIPLCSPNHCTKNAKQSPLVSNVSRPWRKTESPKWLLRAILSLILVSGSWASEKDEAKAHPTTLSHWQALQRRSWGAVNLNLTARGGGGLHARGKARHASPAPPPFGLPSFANMMQGGRLTGDFNFPFRGGN